MSPRRAARVDENQKDIVTVLRQLGFSVQSLAACGQGVPDLLVGRAGRNWLLEVKAPETKRAGGRGGSAPEVFARQKDWRSRWAGQADVVHTLEDCLRVMGFGPEGRPL